MITISNTRITIILIIIGVLLTIPLIAMQFTNEVNWDIFDFALMCVLLLGTGIGIELVLRIIQRATIRFLLIAGIVLILLAIWAELAVGILNTPLAGN